MFTLYKKSFELFPQQGCLHVLHKSPAVYSLDFRYKTSAAARQFCAINFIAAASHKLGLHAAAQRRSSRGGWGGGGRGIGGGAKPHLIRRLREEQRKKGRRFKWPACEKGCEGQLESSACFSRLELGSGLRLKLLFFFSLSLSFFLCTGLLELITLTHFVH